MKTAMQLIQELIESKEYETIVNYDCCFEFLKNFR
jgi:hypothetical protein